MVYTRKYPGGWRNASQGAPFTPLNAATGQHIEDGLVAVSETADAAAAEIAGRLSEAELNAAIGEAVAAGVPVEVAAVLADQPEVLAAVVEMAQSNEGLARRSDPGMPTGGGPDIHTISDARRRRLAGVQGDGRAFATLGTVTPHAGLPIQDGVPVLAGTYDPARRRWGQDALGPDLRFLPETIASIAARIQAGGTKKAPHILNAPGNASYLDTETSRTVRWPVKFPTLVHEFVFHVRNRNDTSTGILYPGEVAVSGIWWGPAARDANGVLTGGFASAPVKIADAFTMPADASEVVVPVTLPGEMPAGTDYILSIGYTCAAQDNHRGVGGGWWSTNAADASATSPTLTQTQFTPFSVWLDCTIDESVPLVAWLGDSLSAATAATLPVYDSPARQHAFANEVWPVMYVAHGSSMTHWIFGDAVRWDKYGLPQCDALMWCIGSNDIFDGTDLATMEARLVQLWPIATTKTGTSRVFVTTILPRNGTKTDTAKEAVRVAYNAHLFQRPMGAVGVFDFAKSVEASVGTLRADYVSADDIHLTTAGYTQAARAVTSRLG